MMRTKVILKSVGILVLVGLLVKVFGFVREILIAYYYGTSQLVDDFNIFMLYPNFMLNTFAPAVGIALISKIISEKNDIHKTIYFKVTNELILLVLFVLVSSFIYSLIIYFYIGDKYELYEYILVCITPILYFIQVIMVYYNQALGNFKIGAISSLFQVIITSLVILLSKLHKDISILLISIVTGLLIQIFILTVYYFRDKTKIKPYYSLEKNGGNNAILAIVTSVFGIGLMEILISITKFTSSFFTINGLTSAINYSYKLMNLPISIIMLSLISVLFPEFSKLEKQGNREEVYNYSKIIINYIIIIMTPISGYLFISTNYLIKFLFYRGSFDNQSLLLTASFFKYIVFLIPLLSLITLLFRVQYVYQQYKQLMINGIASLLLLIFLQFYSAIRENLYVFYISLLVCLLFILLFQINSLKYKFGNFLNIKCLIATAITCLFVDKLIKHLHFYENIFLLLIGFVIYILIYLAFLIILHEKSTRHLICVFRKRFKK
jgi:putative peptidoglycan lipid II flippase